MAISLLMLSSSPITDCFFTSLIKAADIVSEIYSIQPEKIPDSKEVVFISSNMSNLLISSRISAAASVVIWQPSAP